MAGRLTSFANFANFVISLLSVKRLFCHCQATVSRLIKIIKMLQNQLQFDYNFIDVLIDNRVNVV